MSQEQLRKLAGLPALKKQILKEEYEQSSDFDADMDKALKLLHDALGIIRSTSWKKHMRDTDRFHGTEGEVWSIKIEKGLNDNIESLTNLYHHFIDDAN